jgi:hypothetical protein
VSAGLHSPRAGLHVFLEEHFVAVQQHPEPRKSVQSLAEACGTRFAVPAAVIATEPQGNQR